VDKTATKPAQNSKEVNIFLRILVFLWILYSMYCLLLYFSSTVCEFSHPAVSWPEFGNDK